VNTFDLEKKIVADYWLRKLKDRELVSAGAGHASETHCLLVSKQHLAYFNKLTAEKPVAVFTVILAVYSALLKRYFPDFEGFVFSANAFGGGHQPLLFSLQQEEGVSLKQFMTAVKSEVQETYGHAEYDEALTQKIQAGFERFTAFSIANACDERAATAFQLGYQQTETGDLAINIAFNRDFTTPSLAAHFLNNVSNWLIRLQELIELQVTGISILSDEERDLVLNRFNDTCSAYPDKHTMISLFEEQVKRTPDAIAMIYGDVQLSYVQLNAEANKLAHYLLMHCALNKDEIAGILLPKSAKNLVSILAVLKTGAAYLPIDPNYPAERIAYIIENSKLKLLLHDGSVENLATGTQLINVNNLQVDDEVSQDPGLHQSPDDLAYVIYTSGSTGKPKGVMIEHRGCINMAIDQVKIFDVTAKDRVIWFASVAFDASVSEILMALFSGGTLLIPQDEVIKDKSKFADYLKETHATVVTFPPSYLDLLSEEEIAGLRCIITAGEAAHVQKAAHLSKRFAYFNAYGPTECSVCVSTYKVIPADSTRASIPIGRPLDNLAVYILDGNLQPVPVGVEGSIYVAGIGLARGYLNNAALTAERFIPCPFQHGRRMYHTGDVGKWLPDGNIEFLGRRDDQVKIRGHRIEIGEIENALFRANDQLHQVAVAVKHVNNKPVLAAYYVAAENIHKASLREGLAKLLPDYMMPSFFVRVNALPLTPNGKVNKKALPDVSQADLIRKTYVAPQNHTQQRLSAIWQQVLGVEEVGILDDFFELGGNSLLLTRVASAIRTEFSIDAPVKLLFDNTTISALGHLIDQQEKNTALPFIGVQERPAKIPLSFSQERLWLIHRIEGSSHYHIPIVLKLKGRLDKAALEHAFRSVINRHEVLRTVIREEDGQAYQHILPKDQWRLQEATSYNGTLNEFISAVVHQPFDLGNDHLLRVKLLKLDEQEHLAIIVFHHLISDGWSMPIFVQELTNQKEIHELAIQYADYAIWQRNYLRDEVLQGKLAYWQNKLEGVKPLNLPTDMPRPAEKSIKGSALNFKIDAGLAQQLKTLSTEQGVTLFMSLLAAFKTLLYRYTGQHDVCVGTPIANRTHSEIEPLIGFFVNTLALRSNLEGNPAFSELLQQLKITTLDAYAHQDVPFEKIVDSVEQERSLDRTSLFQVLFVLQNNQAVTTRQIGEVVFESQEFEQGTAKFDLSFHLEEVGNGLSVSIQYRSDLFFPATIERMKAHFINLLAAIVNDPQQKIGQLQMLTAAEQKQLLEFNNVVVPYPTQKTIVDLFEEQAKLTPDVKATAFEGKTLTYEQVKTQSNKLANYLRQLGVTTGSMVGLCLDNSLELVLTGMLGILKAGAAYVPMDADYPQERVDYIIEDTGLQFAICNKSCTTLLNNAQVKAIVIEDDWNAVAQMRDVKPETGLSANDLLYIIYTSGSTGRPKGVMITHRNLVDYLYGIFANTKIRSNRSFGLMSTISTDLGNTVLFSSMVCGGTLHVFSKDSLGVASRMHNYFRSHQVDCIKIVPSYWKSLEDAGKLLLPARMIVFGGEELTGEMIKSIHAAEPALKVVNHYGPTETTIGKLLHNVNFEEAYRTVPIGLPFSNSKAYIVDRDLSLCPIGVLGELLIGGDGVSKGYLNKPELTADKFIDNPFDDTGKLYRTGDLARRRPDGNIEFKGRIDTQVKIRGYRVEPAEVEAVLQQSGLVKHCAVLTKADAAGNNELVAYVVVKEATERTDIQAYLKEKLPAYMVPSRLFELEVLPHTSNGKIDRKTLLSLETQGPQTTYTAPVNEIQHTLIAIWQEVLGKQQIGVTDNFFECGGNSLLAIRLINRIEKSLNVVITLREVFNNADILDMSLLIKSKEQERFSIIPKAAEKESYVLSSNQRRLWLACQDAENAVAYNISGGLLIEGDIDAEMLKKAYATLIERHESLRTVLVKSEDGTAAQKILVPDDTTFTVENAGKSLSDKEIEALINAENKVPFELYDERLIRVKLLSLSSSRYLLLITMHHIISDGWSMDTFIREWITLYSSYKKEQAASLPGLPVQYKDFAEWQQACQQSPAFGETINYWKLRLAGELPVLNLPFSFARTPEISSAGEGFEFTVDNKVYESLKQLAQKEKISLFSLLFTAYNVLLHHVSNQREIILGTSVAGRKHVSLEPVIGFFVNTLAIKTIIDPQESFASLLARVGQDLLNDFSHQDMSFEELLNHINYKRIPGVSPVFQSRFVLNNVNDEAYTALQEMNVSIRRIIPREINSKFDLSLVMRPGESQLSGIVEYKSSLFKKEMIQVLIKSYTQLLKTVADDPAQSISGLDTYKKTYQEHINNNKKDFQEGLFRKLQGFQKQKI
jgi:amino acid adenylation domain-containing protein